MDFYDDQGNECADWYISSHPLTIILPQRVYFGNWLRDYSQAVDVGTLKGVQSSTIRILVWVLAFMSFGYATGEFEVTDDRLGVYRPEEHIDNPKDYADNVDARKYDPRLRGPVDQQELDIDHNTGMKNYIANEAGGWSTSAGYIRYSFARAIHYGRMYTHGNNKGDEKDLCEALRCLGQGLHCLEDFGAHTNYTELALRELGHRNVFAHVGTATEINLRGKQVYPLVTGTFGGVDFLHSVLGEANDHVTQSEVDEMQSALNTASANGKRTGGGPSSEISGLTSLLEKLPGTGGLIQEAVSLQAASDQQAAATSGGGTGGARGFDDGDSRSWNPANNNFINPSASNYTDPQTIITKIYPILEFRDKVVRAINGVISKIPGLESLIDKITEKVTLFVMGLLAPYITPLIEAASQQLKQGSSTVVDASANHQYEVWTNDRCSDPTHSLLSKDHFSNILNGPAGQVAVSIVQYVAPRVIYAWDHPDVNDQQVLDDVLRIFHHPAIRDRNCEIHNTMFSVVENWARSYKGNLDHDLSSESVRAGRNHTGGVNPHLGGGHAHGAPVNMAAFGQGGQQQQQGGWGQKGDVHTSSTSSPVPQSHATHPAPPVHTSSDTFPGSGYHSTHPSQQQGYNQTPPPQQQIYGGGYNQHSQQQPPAPAGFVPNDNYAYPSAYQQGYEMPYDQHQPPTQQQQGGWGPPPPGPPPGQGGWGGSPPGPPPGQWGQQGGYGGPPPQQFDEYGRPLPPQGGGYYGGGGY